MASDNNSAAAWANRLDAAQSRLDAIEVELGAKDAAIDTLRSGCETAMSPHKPTKEAARVLTNPGLLMGLSPKSRLRVGHSAAGQPSPPAPSSHPPAMSVAAAPPQPAYLTQILAAAGSSLPRTGTSSASTTPLHSPYRVGPVPRAAGGLLARDAVGAAGVHARSAAALADVLADVEAISGGPSSLSARRLADADARLELGGGGGSSSSMDGDDAGDAPLDEALAHAAAAASMATGLAARSAAALEAELSSTRAAAAEASDERARLRSELASMRTQLGSRDAALAKTEAHAAQLSAELSSANKALAARHATGGSGSGTIGTKHGSTQGAAARGGTVRYTELGPAPVSHHTVRAETTGRASTADGGGAAAGTVANKGMHAVEGIDAALGVLHTVHSYLGGGGDTARGLAAATTGGAGAAAAGIVALAASDMSQVRRHALHVGELLGTAKEAQVEAAAEMAMLREENGRLHSIVASARQATATASATLKASDTLRIGLKRSIALSAALKAQLEAALVGRDGQLQRADALASENAALHAQLQEALVQVEELTDTVMEAQAGSLGTQPGDALPLCGGSPRSRSPGAGDASASLMGSPYGQPGALLSDLRSADTTQALDSPVSLERALRDGSGLVVAEYKRAKAELRRSAAEARALGEALEAQRARADSLDKLRAAVSAALPSAARAGAAGGVPWGGGASGSGSGSGATECGDAGVAALAAAATAALRSIPRMEAAVSEGQAAAQAASAARAEVAQLSGQLSEARARIQDADVQLNQAGDAMRDATAQLADQRAQFDRVERARAQLEGQLQASEAALSTASEAATALPGVQAKAEAVARELQHARAQLAACDAALSAERASRASDADAARASAARAQEQQVALEAKIAQAAAEADAARRRAGDAAASSASLRDAAVATGAELASKTTEVERLRDDLVRAGALLEEQRVAAVRAVERAQATEQEATAAQGALCASQKELSGVRGQLSDALGNVRALGARLRDASTRAAEAEARADRALQARAELEHRHAELAAQLAAVSASEAELRGDRERLTAEARVLVARLGDGAGGAVVGGTAAAMPGGMSAVADAPSALASGDAGVELAELDDSLLASLASDVEDRELSVQLMRRRMAAARGAVTARIRGLESELDAAQRAVAVLKGEVSRRDALITALRAGHGGAGGGGGGGGLGSGASPALHAQMSSQAARIRSLEAELATTARVLHDAERTLQTWMTAGAAAAASSGTTMPGAAGASAVPEQEAQGQAAHSGPEARRSPSFSDLLAARAGAAVSSAGTDAAEATLDSIVNVGSVVDGGSMVAPSVASHDTLPSTSQANAAAGSTSAVPPTTSTAAGVSGAEFGTQTLPAAEHSGAVPATSPRSLRTRDTLRALMDRIQAVSRIVADSSSPPPPLPPQQQAAAGDGAGGDGAATGAIDLPVIPTERPPSALERRLSAMSDALDAYHSQQ